MNKLLLFAVLISGMAFGQTSRWVRVDDLRSDNGVELLRVLNDETSHQCYQYPDVIQEGGQVYTWFLLDGDTPVVEIDGVRYVINESFYNNRGGARNGWYPDRAFRYGGYHEASGDLFPFTQLRICE